MTTYGWYSVLKYKQGDIEYLAYNLYGQETLCNLITEDLVVQEDNYFFCGEIVSYTIYEGR